VITFLEVIIVKTHRLRPLELFFPVKHLSNRTEFGKEVFLVYFSIIL